MERLDEALRLFSQAARLNPQMFEAYNNMGSILMRASDDTAVRASEGRARGLNSEQQRMAMSAFEAALAIRRHPRTLGNYVDVVQNACQWLKQRNTIPEVLGLLSAAIEAGQCDIAPLAALHIGVGPTSGLWVAHTIAAVTRTDACVHNAADAGTGGP